MIETRFSIVSVFPSCVCRECGCGAGDSGCRKCGACRTCGGGGEAWRLDDMFDDDDYGDDAEQIRERIFRVRDAARKRKEKKKKEQEKKEPKGGMGLNLLFGGVCVCVHMCVCLYVCCREEDASAGLASRWLQCDPSPSSVLRIMHAHTVVLQ